MEEQTRAYTPPVQKGGGGLLKWIIIIVIILAALWYFEPDIILDVVEFVKLSFGI